MVIHFIEFLSFINKRVFKDFFLNQRFLLYKLVHIIGAWPSGKAAGFDPVYRRFESYRPSQSKNVKYLDYNIAIFVSFYFKLWFIKNTKFFP